MPRSQHKYGLNHVTSKLLVSKTPLCGSNSVIEVKGHFSLTAWTTVQEFSEPLAMYICISIYSKFLSFPKPCSPSPFPPSWIYHLFFPGKPFFSIWTAWVQLKCNAKQINRIAVRPSQETILAVSVHTESRIEVTQIKCNGVKYIAQGTVTRNYWLTFFPLLTTFQYSFCDWYTVLVN